MDKYKSYFDNMFKDIDENVILDSEQREAIIDESSNQIIIAGAGAGKTTTMVGKVKYLFEIKKVLPEEILIISFTNKAVNELKERINKDFNINAKITTFHKLGYEIIKESNEEKVQLVSDQNQIIKQILKKIHTRETIKTFHNYFKTKFIKKITINLLSIIVPLKILITKEEFDKFAEFSTVLISKYKIKNIKTAYLTSKQLEYHKYISNLHKCYQQHLKTNNLIDFEDMIILAKKAIMMEKVKLSCKYIIIDEYQDISKNRFDLAKEIGRAHV